MDEPRAGSGGAARGGRPTTTQYFALLLVGYLGTAGADGVAAGLVGALVLVAGAVLAYLAARRTEQLLLRRRVTTPARVVLGLSVAMVVFLAASVLRDLLLRLLFP